MRKEKSHGYISRTDEARCHRAAAGFAHVQVKRISGETYWGLPSALLLHVLQLSFAGKFLESDIKVAKSVDNKAKGLVTQDVSET